MDIYKLSQDHARNESKRELRELRDRLGQEAGSLRAGSLDMFRNLSVQTSGLNARLNHTDMQLASITGRVMVSFSFFVG